MGRGRGCHGAISLFVEVAEAEATMQTSENERTERGTKGATFYSCIVTQFACQRGEGGGVKKG